MATETLKSTVVTNLDASPQVVNTAAVGGLARLSAVSATVSPTNGTTAPSIYQIVRIRSNAVVKHLFVKMDNAVATFAGDIGCYYSTGANDGTPKGVGGTLVGTGQEFGAGQDFNDFVPAFPSFDFCDLAAGLPSASLNTELWSVCGKATDPGGFFDICITTTATTTGSPLVYFEAAVGAS